MRVLRSAVFTALMAGMIAGCSPRNVSQSTPAGDPGTAGTDSKTESGEKTAANIGEWAVDANKQAYIAIGKKEAEGGKYWFYAYSPYQLAAVSFEIGDLDKCIYGKSESITAFQTRTEDNKLAFHSGKAIDPKATPAIALRLSFDGRTAACYEYTVSPKEGGGFAMRFKDARSYPINMSGSTQQQGYTGGYGGQIQQGGSLAAQIAGQIGATFGRGYAFCPSGAAQSCSNAQAGSRTLHHCNTNEVVAMVPGNPMSAVALWAGSPRHAEILSGVYGGSCLDVGYATTDGYMYYVTAILR